MRREVAASTNKFTNTSKRQSAMSQAGIIPILSPNQSELQGDKRDSNPLNLNSMMSMGKNEISRQLEEKPDPVKFALNELCKKTPEGFMIEIEQRKFEGKENKEIIKDSQRQHFDKSTIFSDYSSLNQNMRFQRINYS